MPQTNSAQNPWRWLLPLLLLLAALLPLALLSYYNHPFMDDYFNAANARQLGFWGVQRNLYLNWTGRFFSSALLVGLNPMHYDWFDGLRLTPLLLLGLSYAVAYAGLRRLSPAGRPRLETAGLAGIALLVYFQIIPSLYPALYWFTGSMVYTLGGLWVLLTLIAGARAGQASRRGARLGWWLLAAFSAVGAAGSNEITLLHVLLGAGVMAWLRPAARRSWLLVLLLAGAAGAVVLAAPGNYARMAEEYASNPIHHDRLRTLLTAVPKALLNSLRLFMHARALLWLGLMVFWALVVLRWQRAAAQPSARGLSWKWGVPLLGLGLLGTELLLLLAMGNNGFPDRVTNALWLFWTPASMLVVWAAIVAEPSWASRRVPAWSLPVLCTVAGLVLWAQPLPRRAWRELLLNAPSYDRQLLAREELMRGALWRRESNLVVPPILGIAPERVLITGWDLSTSPEFYVNYETALYFGLESLRVDEKLLPQAHPYFRDNK